MRGVTLKSLVVDSASLACRQIYRKEKRYIEALPILVDSFVDSFVDCFGVDFSRSLKR